MDREKREAWKGKRDRNVDKNAQENKPKRWTRRDRHVDRNIDGESEKRGKGKD